MASCASVPFFGALGANRYSARQPRRVTCQGISKSLIPFSTPAVQRSAMGIMRSKASLVRTFVSVARMAARESALPASVPPIPPVSLSSRLWRAVHVGDFLRETVGRTGHAGSDGLTDYEHVGVEIFGASIAAGPSADGVSFIDDKKCAVLAGEIAERLMKAGLGQDDADIGHRRFCQHTSDISWESGFERGEIVEFNDVSRTAGSTAGPMFPRRAWAVPSGWSVINVSSTEPW